MKLWELAFYDHGVYCVEYHWGATRMQARSQVTGRLKRQVEFEVERVVNESGSTDWNSSAIDREVSV